MDEQKQQLIDRIQQAQNILVAVSANPSVDQLSAALGLTLTLNKLDKHATAVFSGKVPSTLEFLKPEETFEKDTDSLRDFIIALDKAKADKLRYKVEDDVVRIFITPYRTSLSDKDLEFSQGDFNVDVVVCLGVTEQQDLDTAITAHGRILHDATVVSVSTQGQGGLGSIHWVDPSTSSLSEMMVGLTDGLDKKLLDGQIATALLTGIVATTDRFRNEKTSPKTMSASAELMAAGANQQLIASELETPQAQSPADMHSGSGPAPAAPTDGEQSKPKPDLGTLEIEHADEPEVPAEQAPEPEASQIHVDDDGNIVTADTDAFPAITGVKNGNDTAPPAASSLGPKRERIVAPPQSDGNLTANSSPEPLDPPTEELTLPAVDSPMLSHNEAVLPSSPAATPLAPTPPAPQPLAPAPVDWQAPVAPAPGIPPVTPDETLTQIEQSVGSPHLQPQPADDAATQNVEEEARRAVEAALSGAGAASDPLQPITALNAQPLGPELRDQVAPTMPPAPAPTSVPNLGFSEPTPGNSPADDTLDMPLPSNPFGPGMAATPSQQLPPSPLAPPPVPPPSAFPGAAPQQGNDGQTPPPVPPPMLPPLQ